MSRVVPVGASLDSLERWKQCISVQLICTCVLRRTCYGTKALMMQNFKLLVLFLQEFEACSSIASFGGECCLREQADDVCGGTYKTIAYFLHKVELLFLNGPKLLNPFPCTALLVY